MNRRQEQRLLRKRLLLARSTLYRLELSKAVLGLADKVGQMAPGSGSGASTSLRSWLFNLVLRRITSAPVARLLGLLGGALSFAQILRLGSSVLQRGHHPAREESAPVVERGSAT